MNYWDHTDDRFRTQAAVIEELPDSPEKARAYEDLLGVAQREFGFPEEFAARLSLLGSSIYTPHSADELTHYAWTRQALDSGHPIAEAAAFTTVWKLKWALDRMVKSADVELRTIRDALTDFEALLDRFGWNRRPAHQARLALATHLHDDAGVREQLAAMESLPRDELADCEACENLGIAQALAGRDPQAAVATLVPTIEGTLTCAEEPMQSLALQTQLTLDEGSEEDAGRFATRGWRLTRDHDFLAGAAARYLRSFVRLGNVDRALDAALPRAAWLDDLSLDDDVMTFSAALALVLRRAQEAGIAPDQVDGEPTRELADRLAQRAEGLAKAFDTRNGSTVVSDRVRSVLDTPAGTEPTLPALSVALPAPAGTRAAPVEPAAAPGGRQADPEAEHPDAVAYGTALREAQESIAADLTDLLEGWLGDRDAVIAAADGPEAWEAIARLDRACAGMPGHDASALLASAVGAAERAGSDVQWRRARAAELLETGGDGAAEGAIALAEELAERGELREAAFALLGVSGSGHDTNARATVERAVDLLRQCGTADLTLARALVQQHNAQVADGDLVAARASLDEAEALPGASTHWLLAGDIAANRARLALAEGDHDRALELLNQSLDVPPRTDERATIWRRNLLAAVLLDHGDWPGVAEQGATLVAIAERVHEPTLLAIGQRFLGIATAQGGDAYGGAELLEAALPVLARNDPALGAETAWALGHTLAQLGERASGSAAFADASRLFESSGDLGGAGEAQYRAGDLAWDADDLDRAEAHHARAVELATQTGNIDLYLRARRDHAGVVATQGDLEAGIEELDGTVDAAVELAGSHGEPGLDLAHLRPGILAQGANFYATAGDPGTAVVRQQSAIAAATDDDERAFLTGTLARFLALDGRLDDATRTLEPVFDSIAEQSPPQLTAILSPLCTALAESGRHEEADALWERRPAD